MFLLSIGRDDMLFKLLCGALLFIVFLLAAFGAWCLYHLVRAAVKVALS